ncbi:Disease resistance protein (TIR-NBS class) [Raphanus sativus]|nr:Disease resistance protein (TIR-NBS class) [Raphanus sativus]
MASSSSSRPRTWRYSVFTSFHGPDVRKTFLSHLRKQFNNNGISMFDDQRIERGQTIAPELITAIRESRISIVVLSKYYASSSWCLDELVEIFKCKEDKNQIVMTVFYGGVDPSDVRKQTGDFGDVFKKTCARKTEEERRKWSQALTYAGNIAGEHFLNCTVTSMIEKIARDVSNKLNATVSNDFEDMVGIEAHLEKMQSFLHLDDEDGVMLVGICGPAGIGKTTIARALHSRLSSTFQLSCFMENLRGSCNNGPDEYGLKLRLQELLLSKTLNQNGMRKNHLGMMRQRLCDQKVLIVLDDVDDLQQLEALANDTNWFGPGSRIIVTTEDQELLEQFGIHNTYHVDFPTTEEACKILCMYAFKRSWAPYGFEKLAERATELCSNLPLGLRVMGSMLRGKKEEDWEGLLHRLEKRSIPKINAVLRVGFDSLHENDQTLFLLIAVFFNYAYVDHVKAMLADSNLDVRFGLKTLAYKSLIQLSINGEIVMHKLLQKVGIQANKSQEPWKRKVLTDTDDILDALENDFGCSGSLMGIRFDISTIKDSIEISPRALKRMRNLRFLRIYNTRWDGNNRVHVPDDMDFPPRLKLLHWEEFPGACLPHTLRLENLVELDFGNSKLKHLWKGTQPLGYLKKLNLTASFYLEELPDLAKATNLEILDVSQCEGLVEIHSSVGNLHKLESLEMGLCSNLEVVPSLFNLASLELVGLVGCDKLRKLPDIPPTVAELTIVDTMLEEFTASIRLWSRLDCLIIVGGVIPSVFWTKPHVVKLMVERSGADIERIPDCFKDLKSLEELSIFGCPKLVSLPEFPRSLKVLWVHNCESLETLVTFPFDSQIEKLYFTDCLKLKLDEAEARRIIVQQRSCQAFLPGREIPEEFNHRAIGNSLTISSNAFFGFKMCVMVSHISEMDNAFDVELMCRISINGCPTENCIFSIPIRVQSEHLAIFKTGTTLRKDEQFSEILFEFSCSSQDLAIVECGVQILQVEATNSELLSETDDGSLSDESFELDESPVEIVEDLHGSLESYDDASRLETTHDDLFPPTLFSFGF